MALTDHVPGMVAGHTRRNLGAGVVYLLLLPLVLVVLPFYLLYAVGTNRNELADALAASPLGAVPSIRNGGWQAAVSVFLVALLLVGVLVVLAPIGTNPTDDILGGDTGIETPDGTDTGGDDGGATDESDATTSGDDPDAGDAEGSAADEGIPEATPNASLEIHHIDVGQADSTLLVTPENETVLVDTGDWRSAGETVIDYLEELGVERIDHLIATHPHADHIGGHAAVIEHYEENHDGIGNIYDSGVPHDTQTFENYLDAVEAYGHELLVVEEGDELPLESDHLRALVLNPPAGDAGTDFHDNSLTLVFEFGDVRYLTTGDSEGNTEQRLVEKWGPELDVDIYQAGHHGSSTSSTQSFLAAVDPEMTVISSDYDSQFGHPHADVLDRFETMAIETYWTGVHGDIVVRTDGTNVSVETAADFSTNPADLGDEKPESSDSRTLVPITVPGESEARAGPTGNRARGVP